MFAVQRYGNFTHTMFVTKVEIFDNASKQIANIVFAILIFLCTSKTKEEKITTQPVYDFGYKAPKSLRNQCSQHGNTCG